MAVLHLLGMCCGVTNLTPGVNFMNYCVQF